MKEFIKVINEIQRFTSYNVVTNNYYRTNAEI